MDFSPQIKLSLVYEMLVSQITIICYTKLLNLVYLSNNAMNITNVMLPEMLIPLQDTLGLCVNRETLFMATYPKWHNRSDKLINWIILHSINAGQ